MLFLLAIDGYPLPSERPGLRFAGPPLFWLIPMSYFSLPIQPWKALALTKSLQDAGVSYQLGAKANPLSAQAGEFDAIDCSGFVRWLIFHATGQEIPDGSVHQHDWAIQHGCKQSTFADAHSDDDLIRIAFLVPAGGKPGHVVLILNGYTMESHGGAGPDRRAWGSCSWMSRMAVYVLSPIEV